MGRARQRKRDRDVSPQPEPKRAPAARSRPARSRPTWPTGLDLAGGLVVLVAGMAVYANSFSVPFLFDDYFSILGNPDVHSLHPVGRFFTQSRGLPHLLDTLNYRWGGESVWGYHLVNVVIHLINALLVYALALLTLRLPVHGGRYTSRAAVLAALIALVFAVHPLQTMAVSYISQRAEALAATFYLTALLVYAAGQSGRLRLSRAPLAVAVLSIGFLGILSKETVASLPAALLLYHFCFLRTSAGERTGDWRMALLLLLPGLYGLYLARHFLVPGLAAPEGGQSAWLYIPSAGIEVEGLTPWRYLVTQFGVVLWYLRLYVLPNRLCFDYGWPIAETFLQTQVVLSLAVHFLLIGIAIVAFRRNRWVTFGIGWLYVALAPSSSIIPIKDAAFDYRMYLPMLGPTMILIVGAADWLRTFAGSTTQLKSAERAGLVLALAVVAALAGGSVARNATLADPLALARDSATKAPNHWRNHFAYGAALVESGRQADAVEWFERAIAIDPTQSTPRIMLGDLYARAGRLHEAEEVLLPAIDAREESVSAAAYRQLGFLFKAQNYSEAAIGMFEEALARKPRWRNLHLEIARLMRHQGRYHDAAMRMNRLVGEDPSYAARLGSELAQINLFGGVQSYEQGEIPYARHMLSVAMEHPSTMAEAAHHLAWVEARAGDDSAALRLLEDFEKRGLVGDAAVANLERLRAGQPMLPPPPVQRSRVP